MFTEFVQISDEMDVDEPHSLANNPLKKTIRKCPRAIRRLGYDFDDDDDITISTRQNTTIMHDISLIRRVQTIVLVKFEY
jgi:hypothetical protein